MADPYGSGTITSLPSKALAVAAQDPIAFNGLPAVNQSMLNGHIGGAQQAPAVTPAARAALIAEDLTPGVSNVNGAIAWHVATGLWT